MGEEYNDQHVGKVWRFEEGGDRKGGIGVDSSEEKLETKGNDRSRTGGTDRSEDSWILLGFWEHRRHGGLQGSRRGGRLQGRRIAHGILFEDNC